MNREQEKAMFAGSNNQHKSIIPTDDLSKVSGSFPPTDTSVGFQKGWNKGESEEKAINSMNSMIENGTGLKNLNTDNKFSTTLGYGIKERLNNKEYSAHFHFGEVRKGSWRDKYLLGWQIKPPEKINFEEWAKKMDVEVKSDSRKRRYESFISISASNPQKINAIIPHMRAMLEESVRKQAEADDAEVDRKQMHDKRKEILRKSYDDTFSKLQSIGLIPDKNYNDVATRESSSGNTTDLDTSFKTKDGKYVTVKASINSDAKITYSINAGYGRLEGLRDLSEGKLLRIVGIMNED